MFRRWAFVSLSFAFDLRETCHAYIQVAALMTIQLLSAAYVISQKPLAESRVEFLNDSVVLGQTYFLLILSGLQLTNDPFLVTDFLLILILIQISFNLLFILYTKVAEIIRYVENRSKR